MDKEKMQDFTLRIAQSNRTQLVVIIYEIILTYVEDAKVCLEHSDTDGFTENLDRAMGFVKELVSALDFKYEISRQLFRLYLYVNRCLTEAKRTKKDSGLKGVEIVINGLRKSFEELAGTDASGPVMQHTQVVYEGFTYGKDSRSQVFWSAEGNRGYKV